MPNAYSYSRFSSTPQEMGDSLRRQEEIARKFAKANGLTLIPLKPDRAKSAFSGEHLKTGELGIFLAMVEEENSKIPKGSWLLVENLDRISRLDPIEATELIFRIVKAGLTIWSASSNLILSTEILKKQPHLLYQLTGELIRAHSESAAKSVRILAANANRVKQARKKIPQKGRCPSWLSFRKDESGWDFIPEHVETVKFIVSETLKGIGCVAICRKLNEMRRPLFRSTKSKKARFWQQTTVRYIQKSRTLIGEYQPKAKAEGDESYSPKGKAIEGYYPAVIDEATFHKMQAVLGQRLLGRRVRDSENIANLFGRILVDGFDGSTMRLSTATKGKKRLMRSSAVRSGDSVGNGFDYGAFEESFLNWVLEIKIGESRDAKRIEVLMGKLATVQTEIAKMRGKFKTASDRVMIADLVLELRHEEKWIVDEIEKEKAMTKPEPQKTVELIKQLRTCTPSKVRELRQQIRVQIGLTCERISVYIFRQKMKLVCFAHVLFVDGTDRIFSVRTERGKPTVTGTDGLKSRKPIESFTREDCLRMFPIWAEEELSGVYVDERIPQGATKQI